MITHGLRTPIIIFHEISRDKKNDKYIFSVDEIYIFFMLLKDNNISTMTCGNILKAIINGGANKIHNTVGITVDDGHKSNFDILLQILLTFEFKATFFITTDWIGSENFMNKEELRYLSEKGMSIQSHAKSHRFLDEMTPPEIKMELYESKAKLEDIIGKEVNLLSIPGGRYNKSVINCAIETDYKAIFSSNPFEIRNIENMIILGRKGLRYPTSISYYKSLLTPSSFFILSEKSKGYGKRLLKKILGGNTYYNMWKLLNKREKFS